MIRNKIFFGERTNEQGELKLTHEFFGCLLDIDIGFGELEQDTKITFTTSNDRSFSVEGNNSNDFPISPRRSVNDERFAHVGAEQTVLEKYVNAGNFTIFIENAGANKSLKLLELIYEI